jgi:hypothetical protein
MTGCLQQAYCQVQEEELVHAADDYEARHQDEDTRTITAVRVERAVVVAEVDVRL